MENYKKRKYNDCEDLLNKKCKINNYQQEHKNNKNLQNEITELKRLVNMLIQQLNYQNNKLNSIEEKIDDNKSILNMNQTIEMLEKNNISAPKKNSEERESSCNYIS